MRSPSIFIGHGSPMNLQLDNAFTKHLRHLGAALSAAPGLVVISAHWESNSCMISQGASLALIHDFYGFPPELYKINYKAKSSPKLAKKVQILLHDKTELILTQNRGLDHGVWAPLYFMFPEAQVPIVQLSIDKRLTLREHYELASSLKPLREEGYVIMGSGNIVHNLRMLNFSPVAQPAPWAVEFDDMIKEAIEDRDLPTLLNEVPEHVDLWELAVPTNEHYVPLLYSLAVSDADEPVEFPHSGIDHSSISMRSVKIG